ncbi:mersacidin family lantibiotic [Mesobacillus maritimus]|uniref:Mersacidin family lantibiotic n=1 Tax=Mesobacillus maritimus TaxID=1643336 RepID=A0ABS7K6Q3_9BACI|nr:mersacidin family lantibiotic [Mesobacillus maritimus]MBY0097853.1 mersacidin family lantibiotic [Mesobacillus maritimus]
MNRSEVLQSLNKSQPAGEKMHTLTREELERVSGAGDVQPEATPTVVPFTGGILFGVGMTKLFGCGSGN